MHHSHCILWVVHPLHPLSGQCISLSASQFVLIHELRLCNTKRRKNRAVNNEKTICVDEAKSSRKGDTTHAPSFSLALATQASLSQGARPRARSPPPPKVATA
ncbi:hypothetical protein EVAR_55847_1 [Eumeta japonica]|uniref:Secreted protein n=1 Tax=Eumeta variegata TaxID=151549 RepID=A0A4C1ZE69_EUMVA|nr:hypothetical protein EVAR_55847_1 [Eumeta japonica]